MIRASISIASLIRIPRLHYAHSNIGILWFISKIHILKRQTGQFSRAIASNSHKPEETGAIGIGRSGENATSIDPPFFLGGIEAEKIEDEATDDGEIGSGIFGTGPHLVVVQCDVEAPMDTVVSGPEEFHLRPLAERNVNLSIHSAPIRQTIQPSLASNVRRDTTGFQTNAQETC